MFGNQSLWIQYLVLVLFYTAHDLVFLPELSANKVFTNFKVGCMLWGFHLESTKFKSNSLIGHACCLISLHVNLILWTVTLKCKLFLCSEFSALFLRKIYNFCLPLVGIEEAMTIHLYS